jgi:two-component system, cell cycle sensor histidine kinase and response regulator CckA
VEAVDGREALDRPSAGATPVDLVLTDIVMPRMNGRDLATEVAARWPHLPVLFMSGYADDEMTRRNLLTPEAPFMRKPFDSGGFAAKLRVMLAQE